MDKNKIKGFSRREFLKAASLATVSGLLASCGPATQVTPAAAPTEAGAATAPTEAAATTGGEAQPEPTDSLAPLNPEAIQWWVGWGELVPMFDSIKQLPQFKELLGGADVEMKPSITNEALFTSLA
ncbi:MAG: twin-arginine translocation signal domain-containing protein, partial [Anaerolineae bacterium]